MINKEIIISTLNAIILILFGFFLINNNSEHWENKIDELSKKILESEVLILERAVKRSTSSAVILASHIKTVNGDMNDFDSYSKILHSSLGGITNLQLAPNGIVSKIYPISGHEKAIGHDIFKSDDRKKEAFLAKKTHMLTLAGPFTLIQGGVAIVARYPVFLNDNNFWGFASALIELDDLINNTDLKTLKEEDYEYRLWRYHPDTNVVDVFHGLKEFSNDNIFSKSINVPNGTWYLDISYVGGTISTSMINISYFITVLVSFLLSCLLYMLLNKPKILSKLVDEKTKELKNKNSELKSEKLELKKLSNAVIYNSNAIFITDKKGKLEYVNPIFEEITSFNLNDIVNDKNNIFNKELKKISKIKNRWTEQKEFSSKDGSKFTSITTIIAIKNDKKEITSYVGVSEDITKKLQDEIELKNKQNLLIQQSKMASIGEMFENIAHQWRQPLSVISVSSSSIKVQKEMNILKDETLLKSLGYIYDNAIYLSDTIEDFRNFFKEDKTIKAFNLDKVINKTLNLLESELKILDIKIILNLSNNNLYGIPNELIQVFMNIISNAKDELIKINTKKYLFITSFEIDENIIINIKDNAGGVPLNAHELIFESRYTSKEDKGTGIGLYMSKRIIEENMQGKISVINEDFEYDNEKFTGANFIIKIPKNLSK